ncbi:NAD-dependent epimerase/dehydratase family protein [Candidatus Puniceispirillum marinum]|uniref:RmlD-like substrate binding domain-containing protein n=1 Tax=Puniceispirillum marinum (strain IMCC1322) TaxID=488538 RepID=D5BSI4_PUNMI|nr:NAD-dependent epimerase/dehydratase family protein [Candidatus Puniceispirillum marinum]ADE39231.1 hypothetical protein SAR116_0988 [Candidatus Puniceispirillum marinum IMCC1322]
MRYFVLGGEGFIGRAIVSHFERQNADVQVITRKNYQSLIGESCDIFINANGNSKKYLADKDPELEYQLSVESVRKSLKDFYFKKYVLLSSGEVYPDVSTGRLCEEDEEINEDNLSNYGKNKRMAEREVQQACSNAIILRLGGLVGKGLSKNPIYDISHNEKLWVSADSEMQYVNVAFAAKFISELLDKSHSGIYNLTGKGHLILSDLINAVSSKSEISPDTPLVKYNLSVKKACEILEVPATTVTVMEFLETNK